MSTEIVCYSRTGSTRRLADRLANATGAGVSAIGCLKYRIGFFGYMLAGRDALSGHRPRIRVKPAPGAADLLLVGSPIWAGHLSAPARSYLARLGGHSGKVGVFLTSGSGDPAPKALAEATALLGRAPDAWLLLKDKAVGTPEGEAALRDFLASLGVAPSRQAA